MTRIFRPARFICALIFVTVSAFAQAPPAPYTYRAQISEVTDGDTIKADISLGFDVWKHEAKLRLLDVYAPETRTTNLAEKKNGMRVKEFLMTELTRLAPDRRVIIQTFKDKDDKYGRYIAIVWAGGKDVNAAIRDFMARNNIKPAGKGVKP